MVVTPSDDADSNDEVSMMSGGRPGQPSNVSRDRARATAGAWAAEMLARPDVLFLDTETTGLDGQAEIVEIAVIDTHGHPLINTLVRPDGQIPAEVIRIHGIDDMTVRDAPRWPEVYPTLLELLQRNQIIVYNAAFDFRLVNQMNERCGFPLLTPMQEREWHCAMRRFASWRAEWNAKYGNYRWHKLDIALAAFGHPPPGHRALGDALACRMVVMGMARGEP